jgi:hypothetical protein
MSRYTEGDDDYEGAQLDQGRWAHNYRAALNGKRGRAALALLREALLALPEPRLIEAAMCTVGGVDRVPEITEEEIAFELARREELGFCHAPDASARLMREERVQAREAIAQNIIGQGCGVCALGALLWHLRVKAGWDPEEAWASLPTLITADGSDPMDETAALVVLEVDVAHTLAYELAFRNDETYAGLTPEVRWATWMEWLDTRLDGTVSAA